MIAIQLSQHALKGDPFWEENAGRKRTYGRIHPENRIRALPYLFMFATLN